jgi:tetratricopeptide (TPR) repeat protein
MKSFLMIFFFLSIVSLKAESIKYTETDYQIIENLFSGNWEKSDSLIEIELAKNSNSIKYNFMQAYNYYYARYFSNTSPNRDETLKLVKNISWRAISIGEKMQTSHEDNYYLGLSYAFLSRANAMLQEYCDAYWNGSKGENYLTIVLEQDPQLYDVYFNLGVNEYFPAVRISGFTSILAWVGGMSGDRELGLNYMRTTAEKGDLFKVEAKFALGLAYSFEENDLKNALVFWEDLHNRFPTNNFFTNQNNRAYFITLINENGTDFLIEEFDVLRTKYKIADPNILNNIGYNLVNQSKFDEALVVFETNINLFPHAANCYDSLAEYFMVRGENEKAIKYYKLAFEKIETDTTINEQFRTQLRESIPKQIEEIHSRINI